MPSFSSMISYLLVFILTKRYDSMLLFVCKNHVANSLPFYVIPRVKESQVLCAKIMLLTVLIFRVKESQILCAKIMVNVSLTSPTVADAKNVVTFDA